MNPRSPADYTIGWICALPLEATASFAMLDERHPALPQHTSDTNVYTLGRIGPHNIVIASLPAGYKSPHAAAVVAIHMCRTFTSLVMGLLVGIGGGVPGKNPDVRLGDVVVSTRVVQYDIGKTKQPDLGNSDGIRFDFGESGQGGHFVPRGGSLNSPPPILLAAINTLEAIQNLDESFSGRLFALTDGLRVKFARPFRDVLFEAGYDHTGGKTCDHCDESRLIKDRIARNDLTPRVHRGVIGSGNQVVMHGITRDQFSRIYGFICFETEAAGVMNDFPCLVIRGISDYADSHKNNTWKPYAAAMAAAYAKGILESIVPETLARAPLARGNPTQHSVYAFTHRFLPIETVPLGRLLLNPRCPWEDFCDSPHQSSEDEILVTPYPRLQELIAEATSLPLLGSIRKLFRANSLRAQSFEGIRSDHEKQCVLTNSANLFKQLCRDETTKSWLQTATKQKWTVYMVVGKHTIPVSSLTPPDLGQTSFSADGEVIVALLCRKVKFSEFFRRNVDSAFLEATAAMRWIAVNGSGKTSNNGDREQQIIEAVLSDEDLGMEENDGGENYTVGKWRVFI